MDTTRTPHGLVHQDSTWSPPGLNKKDSWCCKMTPFQPQHTQPQPNLGIDSSATRLLPQDEFFSKPDIVNGKLRCHHRREQDMNDYQCTHRPNLPPDNAHPLPRHINLLPPHRLYLHHPYSYPHHLIDAGHGTQHPRQDHAGFDPRASSQYSNSPYLRPCSCSLFCGTYMNRT